MIFLLIVLVVVIPISIIFSLSNDLQPALPLTPVGPLIAKNGAVAADQVICSKIGVDILKEGGNAIDSAFAVCLCQGLKTDLKIHFKLK